MFKLRLSPNVTRSLGRAARFVVLAALLAAPMSMSACYATVRPGAPYSSGYYVGRGYRGPDRYYYPRERYRYYRAPDPYYRGGGHRHHRHHHHHHHDRW
jgi:hypothetical protein